MSDGSVRFIGNVQKVEGERSTIEIFSEFCTGLDGLGDFSHIIILYWFHLRDNIEHRQVFRVVPKRHLGAPEVGVFASRSPSRPNPIGLCVAELLEVDNCTLVVRGLDALEGSPILDIKPYHPRADCVLGALAPEWSLQGPKT